tara:strand:+ start:487 stop:1113 length:627 start_codon:yes stop_codon:yes gene_type:complete
MPNLLFYIKQGIQRKIRVNYLRLKEIPDFLVVSPGGCGTVTLIKYLENFGKSNLYFEKKYKIYGLGHTYKPSKYLIKNKIKIIIIKRDFEEIYTSMTSRGFVRNNLNTLGDLIPFMYINILKNKKKLKKKYFYYLEKFYINWEKYPSESVLTLEYPKFFIDQVYQNKIKKFLNIDSESFLLNFPKFQRYNKDKNFIDPSSITAQELNK